MVDPFIHRFVSQQVYSIYKDFPNIDYHPISVGQSQNRLMRTLSKVEIAITVCLIEHQDSFVLDEACRLWMLLK
jgi:hypothetical protein